MPLRTDGDELRRRRELLGITAKDFADAIGYTLNHVSQVELGNRNAGPQYLRKAAEFFECEISDITDGVIPYGSASGQKTTEQATSASEAGEAAA